jgi:uncharacterized membrane protein
MPQDAPRRYFAGFSPQANLIAGILTILPLLAVWFVVAFLLGILSDAGRPFAVAIADNLDDAIPALAPVLADQVVQWFLGIIAVLLLLYAIGAIATRVIGIRIIGLFERIISRIPLVQTIYSAAKQLVGVMQSKPGDAARVVLIEFPHPGLKAVGLVMRTFTDSESGVQLAAVFVPTSPNPTSGYLQIAPVDKLVPTDMSMDQAMTMVISGGATAPDKLSFAGPPKA